MSIKHFHLIYLSCIRRISSLSIWLFRQFAKHFHNQFPGGHSTFFGLLNTFIHIIMYSYYLLAALGPRMQRYLWWKKYLTALQMLQFIAIMVHAFQLLFIDCNYPKAFVWWIGMHAVMFLFLFNEFYQQSYAQKTKNRGMYIDIDILFIYLFFFKMNVQKVNISRAITRAWIISSFHSNSNAQYIRNGRNNKTLINFVFQPQRQPQPQQLKKSWLPVVRYQMAK